MGVSINVGIPNAGWFIVENPIEMDGHQVKAILHSGRASTSLSPQLNWSGDSNLVPAVSGGLLGASKVIHVNVKPYNNGGKYRGDVTNKAI